MAIRKSKGCARHVKVYTSMIGYAEQRGSAVWAYNENGSLLWTKSGTLMGYTSTTVSIKYGNTVFVIGERGETKFMR